MSTVSLRPRFSLEIDLPPGELIGRFRRALDSPDNRISGLIVDHHIRLALPPQERHFWSPQLNLEVESLKDAEGSLIRGHYGPSPEVWLMFVFFYSLLGFGILIVSIMGFSQLNLGLSARILWALPALLLVLLLVFWSARIGQRLGREQMDELHVFMKSAIDQEREAI
ncbi:MAG: hypothetical protein R3350_07415 [Saprospiraceae bacterium]|nr:hypothetical protein [Saprospiraceae bacterium]